ncbi:cell surface complex protein, CscD family [Lacticaseibacillus paracasei]|uniref:LPXTG cell wall anchor domain-containing protein n=1 Tax=Lacticaseibacillus paracasei TaxID=1597 RepID=UPI0009C1BCDE|nr:LPXTG cell wall anchor domain-containing protein [Lacticaseibacillus paracasei]ARE43673.1 cell surface complex protein, CscD family [Lacticaseibacillus paracasei]
MTRIVWRFLISLIIVFGVLGEGIMAAHQVRAATSIGEVVVIDDRPKPDKDHNAPGTEVSKPKEEPSVPPRQQVDRLPQTSEGGQTWYPLIGFALLMMSSLRLQLRFKRKDRGDDDENRD